MTVLVVTAVLGLLGAALRLKGFSSSLFPPASCGGGGGGAR